MAIRDTTQLPQPAGSTVALPTGYPDFPPRLDAAFPGFAAYHASLERIYRLTRAAIRNTADDLILPINQAVTQASFASASGLTARIEAEENARVDGDEALATSISVVSASVVSGDATLTAAITAESVARATKDGYVESSYTLTATAGHVTTGMRLISAGGTTPVSAVIFQAGTFQIYNGSTGIPAFDLTAGNLTLNGSITLLNTQVSGLGSLATQNSVAYGSITGTKPPSNADVTLSAVNGGLNLTGGGLILASGGAAIRGGQTAYDTGAGFWLGDVGGTTKFSIGNSAGNKMTWDGSALAISGTITSTSGSIGGFTVVSTAITGTNVSLSSTGGSNAFSVGVTGAARTAIGYSSGTPTLSQSNGSGIETARLSVDIGGTNGGYFNLYDSLNNLKIQLLGHDGQASFQGAVSALSFSGSGSGLTSLNASNISSGTVAPARLGTGSGGASKFLREDSTWQTLAGGGDLLAANNLSDLANATTARSNLGLGNVPNVDATNGSNISSGTVAPARLGSGSGGSTKFLREDSTWQTVSGGGGDLLAANNLSELTNDATARSNLGLGSIATQGSSSVSFSGGTINGCGSNGFTYSGVAGGNRISFGWDGANVRTYVDGSLQGTVPNP